ncbi:hypothetical protein LQR31_03060 [Chromobacterium vaccinii]|uniref:hypothetical protein n=1 Tax=Chromobacterium vaccinii TaxID=1108595 RepID=UPI001E55883E|nr:hypothetical protein [Chromobacterium vaccinii]MCD4483451.1 hypothetical protein [Chromobacterium vaccinii]
MQVFRNGQPYGFVQEKYLLDMLVERLGSDIDEFSCLCAVDEAKTVCEEYILQAYPVWRQMNVLREGSQGEKSAMSDFINACRAWSNGPKPDPLQLSRIKP